MRKRALAVVSALLVFGIAATARAGPTPHMMTGHWAGFFRSVENPTTRGSLTLDVSSQDGRRFSGEIRGIIIDNSIPVDGTVSESGQTNMTGKFQRGTGPSGTIKIHTSLTEDGNALIGRFRISSANGGHESGDIVAVHQVPVGNAPSFAGDWSGRAQDPPEPHVPVDLALGQDRSGALDGVASWGEQCMRDGSVCPSDPTRIFSLAGQAFGDPSGGGFTLVGAADDALVAIGIIIDNSRTGGELGGSYVMFKEVDPAPAKTSVEQGSITLLPAVQ